MSFKSGFISIIGRPNVGKSTLMNALIQHKVAIVSPKAQTTRNKIQGILTTEQFQMIFIDTPGIHKPHNKLGESMNKMAFSSRFDSEVVLLLLDCSVPLGSGDQYVIEKVKNIESPLFVVLNKIDLVSKEKREEYRKEVEKIIKPKKIVEISALQNNNLASLLRLIEKELPEGPKYYPSDMISANPETFIMAELVREKILLFTREEVPHSVAVVIEDIERKRGGILDISALIIIERESQKGIIIGSKGSMLKKIGIAAREDIETLLGSKVNLRLFVKVKLDWRNNISQLNDLGYKDE